MTPAEKHMDAARAFVREHFNTSKIVDPEAYAERIAKAMTIGEREGMKRAAEIARGEAARSTNSVFIPVAAKIVADRILSEAGENE